MPERFANPDNGVAIEEKILMPLWVTHPDNTPRVSANSKVGRGFSPVSIRDAGLKFFYMDTCLTEEFVPNLMRIAPELPTSNLRNSIDYYVMKLGFQNVMTMPEGDYGIVQRDGVAIHLFQAQPNHSAQSIHIFTDDLDQLHTELQQRGAEVQQGIVRKPWGNRDFRVRDDFGNEIKFTEPLS